MDGNLVGVWLVRAVGSMKVKELLFEVIDVSGIVRCCGRCGVVDLHVGVGMYRNLLEKVCSGWEWVQIEQNCRVMVCLVR